MAAYPEYLELGPFDRATGRLRLPGSKSISNRVLLLAALGHGITGVHDLLSADDVNRMLEALEKLGVKLQKGKEPGHLSINGCGGTFPVKSAELFLGNAGTALRPLTAALALCGGHYRLSGVPRMHERPIGDLVDALRQVGANVRYLGKEGFPPLEIRAGNIDDAGKVRVSGEVSSQFLTALLMALPLTGKQTTIEVVGDLISKPYVEITLNLMARFGVQVRRAGWSSFTIPADSRFHSPG
ncbi:MAG TPA: 3-phosphoshikimate 1-carboxyvinyltransferase, partial [Burkholderiales bacterium]|nr:3-phosphoshikimate 1-carboxyvinyltransferase [Burkholderiales bacterium]